MYSGEMFKDIVSEVFVILKISSLLIGAGGTPLSM